MMEIKKISLADKNYPALLKKIKKPPQILYFQGELKNEKCLAIVGMRRCSDYGKQIAWEIASELADAGLTIVSGLAPGIDTIVHQAVVERKKRTIAVLGTGLDEKSLYPRSNLKLARQILENNGCLISEYPIGTPGSRFTFPQRNRIIAGLSLGVLVIEAQEKSGSLITAQYAFQNKRKVWAIPGSIFSSNSKGCHALIKAGARLVENAADILADLKLNLTTKTAAIALGENEEENLILNVLKNEALYIEKIIEKTQLPAAQVASTLAILEVKNKVKNLGNNLYAINHR